jgi:hypothetical protein
LQRPRPWHEHLATRPWSKSERRVVWRGFFGRLTIAIEPLLVAIFFSLLPLGLLLRKQEAAIILAPIFGVAGIVFFAYGVYLMVSPTRALLETRSPIYIIDGYIHYRRDESRLDAPYRVAALDANRQTLGEWPLHEWPQMIGDRELWPALIEFSEFGGIHKIDGHGTGVLPEEIAAFGIGIAAEAARRDPKRY